MSGNKSRRKGMTAENELIRLLREQLGDAAVSDRNLCQYQRRGLADFTVLDYFNVEVKRYAKATKGQISKWWQQAIDECPFGYVPVLAYRFDGDKDWTFMLDPHVGAAWQCGLLEFCEIARESI